MRRNVIAFLVFLAVVGGGYLAFRQIYYYHGYSTVEEQTTRLYYVARVQTDAAPYHQGDIVVIEQNYAVGDNYVVSIAQRPLPVLRWMGAWYGVPPPPGAEEPARLERGTFKPMSAIEIQAARVENERIKHSSFPSLRSRPMSERPKDGQAVTDSARFAYLNLSAGASYVYLTLEEKAAKGKTPYEYDYVYWVEPDGMMQCRKGISRGVLNE